MKKKPASLLNRIQSKFLNLLTRYCVFFLSDNGLGLLNVVDKSLSAARMHYYQNNMKSCGDGVSIQFPVMITHPESIEFGDRVSLAAFVHIWGKGGVTIGNRVMIGAHTAITSLTHDYNESDMYSSLVEKPVIIGDDVWIGSNCVIVPGVRIGNGAVVGAGSVVTRNVESNAIVAGGPARPIKLRT